MMIVNDFNSLEFSELENLVMNMSAGLLPEFLKKDEVELLEEKYGENWFEKMGYAEPKYKKPNFEKENYKVVIEKAKKCPKCGTMHEKANEKFPIFARSRFFVCKKCHYSWRTVLKKATN